MQKIYLKQDRTIEKDISNLYLSAFPENERPPLWWFYKAVDALEENVVIGYYDNDQFIGFTYVTIYKDIVYLVYFAVSENKRNQGYGTKILEDLRKSYPNYVLLLCYEEVDEKCSDYPLRKRRQNFYLRNGYIDNQMYTREGPVIYQSAYNGSHPVRFIDYKKIFDQCYGDGASDRYLKLVKEY